MTLFYGLVGSCLVLLAALGVRMVRTSVVDDLIVNEQATVSGQRSRPFTQVVDLLGGYTQRVLLGIYGESRLERLRGLLRTAGHPEGLTAQLYVQREAGFITLGLVLFVVFALSGNLVYGVLAGVLFASWMYVWLLLVARDRTARIERELPDFLDVFAVTVAAGLPFRVAMQRVAEHHSGVLGDELRLTLREMQLGVGRRASLERMRERTKSENVATFVTALLQAEELGTPLVDALQDISAEIRRARAQSVRQAAAKAQPKVSLVITMTILPGALVLIIGGLIINNIGSIGGLFGG